MPTKQKQQLAVFNFNGKALTVLNEGTQPWFIASEVCNVLELTDTSKTCERLDADEKMIRKLFVSSKNRAVLIINESGLYSLTLTSNKPEAKAFKKWITSEVLPSIRKTGSYSAKPTQSAQDIFLKNHRAACLLFTAKKDRLLYANARTLEQTGINIMEQAGIKSPLENYALKNLLNTRLTGGTIQQLLDAVHYTHENHIQAAQLLLSQFIRLKNGVIVIGNKCPLPSYHREALIAVPSAIYKVAEFKGTGSVKSILIQLY